MPRCDSCRAVVLEGSAFCPRCGTAVGGEPAPPPPAAPGWGTPAAPASSNNNGCLIALAIVGGLIVLVVVAALVAVAVGGKKVAHNIQTAVESAQATCGGFSYPDHQATDHCAALGSPVLDFGQTVTASNARRLPGLLNRSEICADVTYLNRSNDTKNYNRFDWKLQTPTGKVQSFQITGATLGSGQLVSGGTTSGSVCFDDGGEHGQFVLIWKPDVVRPDRGIWLVQM
jgi:hypothetical protein